MRALGLAVVLGGLAMAQSGLAAGVPPNYLAIEWRLFELDGGPYNAGATIDLSNAGHISGRGPCNNYSARVQGDLPDLRPMGIRSTKRACSELAQENAYLSMLSRVVRAEVAEDILILTTADGRSLRFIRPVE